MDRAYFTNEGEGEYTPYGVRLGFLDPTDYRLWNIVLSKSLNDSLHSYSPAAEFTLTDTDNGKCDICIRVFNYGDADSLMSYLWFIVWSVNGTCIIKRIKKPLTIKGRSSEVFNAQFDLKADFGLNSLDDLYNIYSIISNPLEDAFEPMLEEFIARNLNGDFALDINPCRISIKAASYNLTVNPFTIHGNSISINSNRLIADFSIESVDAADNAFMIFLNPHTISQLDNMLGRPRKELLGYVELRKTDFKSNPPVNFSLVLNNLRTSENSNFCRLSVNSKAVSITLNWEDRDVPPQADFNDYIVNLTFR